jgi:hypothetical protein
MAYAIGRACIDVMDHNEAFFTEVLPGRQTEGA